jgi:hypothetical protein
MPSFAAMNTPLPTILRDRAGAAALALGLLSLLAACGDRPTTADVAEVLPRPADAGVVEQPVEQPCDDLGGGQPLPPTTFRGLTCHRARPTSP